MYLILQNTGTTKTLGPRTTLGSNMRQLLFAILGLSLVCCSIVSTDAAEKNGELEYIVKITDFRGSDGYRVIYCLTADTIEANFSDDVSGTTKELLRKVLSEEEASAWKDYWGTFHVQELEERYVKPSSADGLNRMFNFNIRGHKKTVAVRNKRVKQLSDLILRVNMLLPEKLRMSE